MFYFHQVRLDCMQCTFPGRSVLNGIKIADRLQEKFDVDIFGYGIIQILLSFILNVVWDLFRWDIQWATDWGNFDYEDSCEHEYGAAGLLMRLMELPTKQKDKVSVKAHNLPGLYVNKINISSMLSFGLDGAGDSFFEKKILMYLST